MKPKTKRTWKIILNVFTYLLFALILILTVFIVKSGGKGYTSVFGTAFVAVQSDSMDGDREDSFPAGALLKVRVLSEEEKYSLKTGDVISFYDVIGGKVVINSHRIVEVWNDGTQTAFFTQGDNVGVPDASKRTLDEVIGKVVGHTDKIGKFFLFLRTPAGFGVCVVMPCFILLGYCVYDLVVTVREQKKREQKSEKEILKEQLLNELRAEGKIPSDPDSLQPREEKTEKAEPKDEE